jgi:hypothetical protein
MRLMGAKIRRYEPEVVRPPRTQARQQTRIVIAPEMEDLTNLREGFGGQKCLAIEDSSRLPGISARSHARSCADIQVLSFGPGKALCLGEGGAVLFRKLSYYKAFVRMTQHPERMAAEFRSASKVPRTSLNARMHPLSAILGCAILETRRMIGMKGADEPDAPLANRQPLQSFPLP